MGRRKNVHFEGFAGSSVGGGTSAGKNRVQCSGRGKKSNVEGLVISQKKTAGKIKKTRGGENLKKKRAEKNCQCSREKGQGQESRGGWRNQGVRQKKSQKVLFREKTQASSTGFKGEFVKRGGQKGGGQKILGERKFPVPISKSWLRGEPGENTPKTGGRLRGEKKKGKGLQKTEGVRMLQERGKSLRRGSKNALGRGGGMVVGEKKRWKESWGGDRGGGRTHSTGLQKLTQQRGKRDRNKLNLWDASRGGKGEGWGRVLWAAKNRLR